MTVRRVRRVHEGVAVKSFSMLLNIVVKHTFLSLPYSGQHDSRTELGDVESRGTHGTLQLSRCEI